MLHYSCLSIHLHLCRYMHKFAFCTNMCFCKCAIAFAQIDAFIYDEESSLFGREKEDIEHRLIIEFADHFSGAAGRFNVSLKKDEAVLRAIEFLKNGEKYTGAAHRQRIPNKDRIDSNNQKPLGEVKKPRCEG